MALLLDIGPHPLMVLDSVTGVVSIMIDEEDKPFLISFQEPMVPAFRADPEGPGEICPIR